MNPQEILEMSATLEKATAQIRHVTETLKLAREEILKLRTDLATANSIIDKLSSENEALKNQIRTLESLRN